MRIALHASKLTPAASAAIVLLPAALTSPDDFLVHGLGEAIHACGLHVDLLIPDLHADYYLRSHAVEVLDDMLRNSVADRYTSFWLAGISLGGYGVMQHARRSRASLPSLRGRFLIAPYLGSREIVNAVKAAGGLHAWRGNDSKLPDAPLWRWLQTQANTPLAANLYLGCGSEDRFALSSQLIETLLPRKQVFASEGDHSFAPWLRLWIQWLAAVVVPELLEKRCAAEAD